MLWTPAARYFPFPFELEKDLETAIHAVKADLFGGNRIYLGIKKLIGKKGVQQNIPDAYILDLSSKTSPKLFVVEVELTHHDHLKHIAVQILQFSLAFETNPLLVKQVLRQAIKDVSETEKIVGAYAKQNGFENIDYLLERIVHRKEAFNALLIIDESAPELENVLQNKFRFPVEILTVERFKGPSEEIIYRFEPLLSDVDSSDEGSALLPLDPSQLDTIVVPAQEDGFIETAQGENRWHHIRLSAAMIPQIKHIAFYRVAPVSAVTHWAKVQNIQPWNGTAKYELVFDGSLQGLPSPVSLVPKGKVRPLQAPRYTSHSRLLTAKNLDEAF